MIELSCSFAAKSWFCCITSAMPWRRCTATGHGYLIRSSKHRFGQPCTGVMSQRCRLGQGEQGDSKFRALGGSELQFTHLVYHNAVQAVPSGSPEAQSLAFLLWTMPGGSHHEEHKVCTIRCCCSSSLFAGHNTTDQRVGPAKHLSRQDGWHT